MLPSVTHHGFALLNLPNGQQVEKVSAKEPNDIDLWGADLDLRVEVLFCLCETHGSEQEEED